MSMTATSPDITRTGVIEPSATVRTVNDRHRQLVDGTIAAVNTMMPTSSVLLPDQVVPSASQPVPKSIELAQVGAARVGSEVITPQENTQSELRDWKHRLNRWYHKFFGGGTEKRFGPLGSLARKIGSIRNRKAEPEKAKPAPTEELD